MKASEYFNRVIERIETDNDRITVTQLQKGYNGQVGLTRNSETIFACFLDGTFFWDDETLSDLRNSIRTLRDLIIEWNGE